MLLGLWLAKSLNQVRGVMVAGASCLLALSVWLTIYFIQQRDRKSTTSELQSQCCISYAVWFLTGSVALTLILRAI